MHHRTLVVTVTADYPIALAELTETIRSLSSGGFMVDVYEPTEIVREYAYEIKHNGMVYYTEPINESLEEMRKHPAIQMNAPWIRVVTRHSTNSLWRDA